jgi:hypothetical protein
LATLSDIIVYSPTVNGAARSPHALRLARRFKQALEKKRHERVTQLYHAKEMARNERKNDDVDDRGRSLYCYFFLRVNLFSISK